MDFQFNTANDITGDDDVKARIEAAVRQKLDRISSELTRLELHIVDVNGKRGGPADKRARLEARPRGRSPLSVTHEADTIDKAAAGAADKMMAAFARERGRLTSRKGH
jgi:hypothetical protein